MGPKHSGTMAESAQLTTYSRDQMDVHHAGNFPQQLHEQQFPLTVHNFAVVRLAPPGEGASHCCRRRCCTDVVEENSSFQRP